MTEKEALEVLGMVEAYAIADSAKKKAEEALRFRIKLRDWLDTLPDYCSVDVQTLRKIAKGEPINTKCFDLQIWTEQEGAAND